MIYADNWLNYSGPVFIVEGPSDVAAGITLGLCVVGRPSNIGGVDLLAQLLRNVHRKIIVIAERDQKKHNELSEATRKQHDPKCKFCLKCFPGGAGAKSHGGGVVEEA